MRLAEQIRRPANHLLYWHWPQRPLAVYHFLKGAAACGHVEIFAKATAWNGVLWLIMNTLKQDGKPVYTGEELGALRESLPIVWR